jgi:predicted transposase/invertase (TIGR01784 family)
MLPPEQRLPLAGAKLSILDLKARDAAGNTFVIEVQVLPMKGFLNRIVFNACRAYDSQLKEGQSYAELNPVIGVSICDFELWPDAEQDAARQPRVPLVSRWKQTEKLGASNQMEQVSYVFVELPKVPEEGPLRTDAERWAWLFRQGSKLSSLPGELSPEQKEAMMLADRTAWSEAKTEAYRKALDEVEQARQVASEAEARGEARGKADGLREGLQAAVGDLCELLAIALTEERTAHLAALDLAGLETLRVHLKTHKSWP